LSAQAHHKENAEKLETRLRQSQTRATALEQDISRKEEHIKRTEQEFQAQQLDAKDKLKKVCDFAEHLINWLTTNIILFSANLSHCEVLHF